MKRKAVPIIAAVLAVAAMLVAAPTASAAGRIGPFAPADVTCDWKTGSMVIAPKIGAAPELGKQRVAWRHYFRADGGAWSEPTDWRWADHTPVQYYYDPFRGNYSVYSMYVNVNAVTLYPTRGVKYEVWTEYSWFDGIWHYQGVPTTKYTWTSHYLPLPWCVV